MDWGTISALAGHISVFAVLSVTSATMVAPILALLVGAVTAELFSRHRNAVAARARLVTNELDLHNKVDHLVMEVVGGPGDQFRAPSSGLKGRVAEVERSQKTMQTDVSTLVARTATLVENGGASASVRDRLERIEAANDAIVAHFQIEVRGDTHKD